MLKNYEFEEILINGGCYDLEANKLFIEEYQNGKLLGIPVRDLLDTPKRIAHFISQIAHESEGLSDLNEDIIYSRGRIKQVFGKYCKTEEELDHLASSPEALFNTVYGGRLGNVNPGDGFRYIGRGFIMVTGRKNYQRLSDDLGLDFVGDPLLLENPLYALYASLSYFVKRRVGSSRLLMEMDDMTVEQVTRVVNGGRNGLADRQDRYDSIMSVFNESRAYCTASLNRRSPRRQIIASQYILTRLGYEVGKPDGYFGRKTNAGYEAFREDANVKCSLFNLMEEFYMQENKD